MTELTARKPLAVPIKLSRQGTIFAVVLFVFMLVSFSVYLYLSTDCSWDVPQCVGPDWRNVYLPRLSEMLAGQSPYLTGGVFNPPWILALLLPLVALPPDVSSAILAGITAACFALAAIRLHAKPASALFFLLTPAVTFSIRGGNVDFLVALGASLPPQIGLFLVLAKPQMGAILALFWLWEAWRRGRFREVARVFGPLTAAFLLSFVLYGNWVGHALRLADGHAYWNTSLFPASIPIGIALAIVSFRSQKPGFALAAAPFFSPYVGAGSWSTVVLGLLPDNLLFVAVALGSLLTNILR
jgi:uncharacterized membrane protein (DUF485 family)